MLSYCPDAGTIHVGPYSHDLYIFTIDKPAMNENNKTFHLLGKYTHIFKEEN